MLTQTDEKPALGHSKAYQIMSHPLFTLRPDDAISEAAAMFIEYNISGAPVMGANGPVGVLTKTDITRYERERSVAAPAPEDEDNGEGVAAEAEVPTHPVSERVERWMTPDVLSVEPDAELDEITRVMLRNGVHHLFVRDPESGHLAGMITTFDLLRVVAHALNPDLPGAEAKA